jgi:hypothetical protein
MVPNSIGEVSKQAVRNCQSLGQNWYGYNNDVSVSIYTSSRVCWVLSTCLPCRLMTFLILMMRITSAHGTSTLQPHSWFSKSLALQRTITARWTEWEIVVVSSIMIPVGLVRGSLYYDAKHV